MDPLLEMLSEVTTITKTNKAEQGGWFHFKYTYRCNEPTHFVSVCQKPLCKTKKTSESVFPRKTIPTYSESSRTRLHSSHLVCERRMISAWKLDDVGEFICSFHIFRKMVGEQLKIYVPKVKADDWEEIVAMLFENIKIDEVPADVSKVGEFLDYLKEFCLGRGEAFKMDELEMQKSFTDYDNIKTFIKDKKEFKSTPTYLRLVDLSKWLESSKNFKVQRVWIVQRLKEIGGTSIIVSVRKVQTRAWVIPAFEKSEEEITTPSSLKSKDKVLPETKVLGGDSDEEIPF